MANINNFLIWGLKQNKQHVKVLFKLRGYILKCYNHPIHIGNHISVATSVLHCVTSICTIYPIYAFVIDQSETGKFVECMLGLYNNSKPIF